MDISGRSTYRDIPQQSLSPIHFFEAADKEVLKKVALNESNGTDRVILVNVYAPIERVARENIFYTPSAHYGKHLFMGFP